MATAPLTGLVGHVCRSSRDAGLTDGQLLDEYLARRDEAAFECLVWRHGPAVLGACRRILQNESDAEDAFQATFLVLVRKARAVRPRDAVGAWLYGVACNVARKARADGERRRAKDMALSQRLQPDPIDPDLRPAIDFEVERLPEKYRAPIVLCELEEQPIADAAMQLGWPQGTVASRLARARELLGKRLVRQGIGLSALVGVTLTSESVAGVLRAVRESGVPSNRLADAVVRSMFLTKIKTMAAAVACVALVLMGGFALRMTAGEKGDAPNPGDPPKKSPVKVDPAKPEANPIVGRWKLVKQVYNGEAMEPPGVRRVVISDSILQVSGIGLRSPFYSWKANPDASPASLDLAEAIVGSGVGVPKELKAIYKLDGDTLTVALHHLPLYGVPGNDKLAGRPTEFGGKDVLVLTFERDKAEKADFERLVGRWRVLGDRPYKVIEFREQPHQGLMIAENAKHEADWFSWIVDERKEPRQIDVYARVEGASNPNHGIYRFKGDRLQIYLGVELKYQGDPGKHTRPTSLDVDGKTGPGYLELERENVAWGKPIENGLQFGVLAEPNGRTKVEIGDTVEFRLFVRNTTNKAIDVDLPKMDGVPLGWSVSVRDGAGKDYKVTEQPPPPGVPVSPSRLKLKMVDYQVADIGTFKLRFVARDDSRAADYPPATTAVSPGDYSIRFTANKMWATEGTTGEIKLKVETAVAWGPTKDGLQFGLALGKGQSHQIHIGERARFRVLARNTSDKEATIGVLQVHHLPMFAEPQVDGKGDIKGLRVRFVRGPDVKPPPANLKVGANETVELPGEFVLPFLPHQVEGETHVVAQPGNWNLLIPTLDTWMTSRGYATGGLSVEIMPGDVEHTDGQQIAWGPVADGLQFGLKPDKDEYTIGDNVKFTVHARNMSDKELTFMFPSLGGWWPNNGTPIIKDADGNGVKPHLAEPGGPIGPQAVTKHTVKQGEMIEVTSVWWIFVNRALPGLYKVDYAVIEKAGEYRFQYPDLHGKNKPAWPTGFARLSFKNPAPANAKNAQPKNDAERLLGHWTKDSEKVVGRPEWKGRYRMLEFRSQPVSGLLVGHGEADEEHWFTWKIDATKSPKEIDISARVPGFSMPNFGIYEFDGERLRIGLGAKFLYTGNPGKHARPTSMATAAHVIELIPGKIAAWGVEKDGLQFGLVAASTTTHLGDSVRFQVNVKNTTDTPKEFEARKVETLPAYVGARATRANKAFKTVTALPPGGLPKPDKVAVPSRTTQVVGEFTVHFLPIESENFGAHIVADAGKCTIDVPDLNGWLTVPGYSTGKVEVELLPWDRAHVDSLGVSWGDAVGGLQYGLLHADPAKIEFKHHDKIAVKLWARYFGAGSLEVSLPVPDELWQVGRPATVLDAKGKAKPFGMPAPIPREPAGLRKHTLRSGTPVEVGTATWPIVVEGPNKAREFGVPTILAVAGTYTIHFPSVGGAMKAGEVPIGTGKLWFTVK